MKHLIFSLFIVPLWFTSCKKYTNSQEVQTLPPITQIGANTFGCKINGVVWVPHYPCELFVPSDIELEYNIYPLSSSQILPLMFTLNAGKIESPYSGFFNIGPNAQSIALGISDTGNYASRLAIQLISNPIFAQTAYGNPRDTFLITKVDTIRQIISGVFSFTMYYPESGNSSGAFDSLKITDGRFDLHFGDYYYCSP
jgi:hypothetical protein